MRRIAWMIGCLGVATCGTLLAAALTVVGSAGPTVRVSVSTAGVAGDGLSRQPSTRGAGEFVAFASDAAILVPGDSNGARDIFLRDRARHRTERVSVGTAGAEGNGSSLHPSICASAERVAFESVATNLVPDDTNDVRDIFVRDRTTGETRRVSVSSAGAAGNGASFAPSISSDGRVVAFRSAASNLVEGDGNGTVDVFVHDLETGTTVRASVSHTGDEADGPSNLPSISASGRFVAFESVATNLVADDDNDFVDIFVRDLAVGTTTRASVASDGTEGSGESRAPSISGDGRVVAFESIADNLVAGDANEMRDVFVRNLQSGTTTRVSRAASDPETNGESREASIAGDGGCVAFTSDASNLVDGDTNEAADVFLHDIAAGTTVLVSTDATGAPGDAASARGALSEDGTVVAFDSAAGNLTAGDDGSFLDVFVRDLSAESDVAIACRAGNVNSAAGETADVLLVNGSPGDATERAVVIGATDAIEIAVAAPPSKPAGPSAFALYAWFGPPDPLAVRTLPHGLGIACMPMPLGGGGSPLPRAIWNNIGKTSHLGPPTLPSNPAPSVLFSKPGGIGRQATAVLQGLILDSGAPQGQAAVTNAVVIHIL